MDQLRAVVVMASLTHSQSRLCSTETKQPKMANGNRQYPTVLIDWKIDLNW